LESSPDHVRARVGGGVEDEDEDDGRISTEERPKEVDMEKKTKVGELRLELEPEPEHLIIRRTSSIDTGGLHEPAPRPPL
jgi:hypothetical protein